MLSDGTLTSFNIGAANPNTLKVIDNNLWVGGSFSSLTVGNNRIFLNVIDESTKIQNSYSPIKSNFGSGMLVNFIGLGTSHIYIGGEFRNYENSSAGNFIKLDRVTFAPEF